MPALEVLDLKGKAVLWAVLRYDRQGNPVLAPPVEIPVRWEEAQTDSLDPQGQQIVVDVIMATNRNIVNGSLLWEGSLDDLEEEAGTAMVPAANIYELVTRNRGDDLKGRSRRFEFGLKRFKDTLPTVVGA